MIPKTLAVVFCLACAAGLARAEPEEPPAFMRHLYPPELVMRHQQEIGLSGDQRAAITAAIGETQAAVLEIQWQLQELDQRLEALFGADPIDEAAALEEVSRALDFEERVKTAHLRLLIRIRNQLTAAQRQRLESLRAGS